MPMAEHLLPKQVPGWIQAAEGISNRVNSCETIAAAARCSARSRAAHVGPIPSAIVRGEVRGRDYRPNGMSTDRLQAGETADPPGAPGLIIAADLTKSGFFDNSVSRQIALYDLYPFLVVRPWNRGKVVQRYEIPGEALYLRVHRNRCLTGGMIC